MGLLGIVAAQARRVDLLPKLVRFLPILSILLVAAGIGNLYVLPLDGYHRETYRSENALLTHGAITFFRESDWNIVRGFKGLARDYEDRHVPEIERNAELVELFTSFGLQAHTHDWAHGQNFYAINTASRGPHNEAIVVAAPWRIGGEFNEGGVALLISLARFFRRWNFWHKNLIFVLSSDDTAALREWVAAYHSSLQYTAGSIEGAVVLDYSFPNENFETVEVGFEGLNGQLPNLDLVNAAIDSVGAEFSKATILDGIVTDKTYDSQLTSLKRHIWQQLAAGVQPSRCASAMFSGWRIDAITLRAVEGQAWYDITTLGRVCESTVRSINNLLEHFHQSFFFYLMLAPKQFVSIASYLPSGMLVAASFSLMAVYRVLGLKSVTISDFGMAAGLLTASLLIGSAVTLLLSGPLAILAFWAVNGVGSFALSFNLSQAQKRLLNALGLALTGLELTTLSMVNFSLALALGVVCVPLAWVRPGGNQLLNFLLASCAGPATVLSVVAAKMDSDIMRLLGQLEWSWDVLNVWTWGIIGGIWVPLWMVCLASA